MTKVSNIDSLILKDWLDNEKAILIDVREAIEYKTCSIPGSINLPLSLVTANQEHFKETKGKKIVFHCKSGKRSMMACNKLLHEGINFDIWNLEGGIDAWKKKNLVTIYQSKIMPIERQVQIFISALILSGLSLNCFLDSSLYLTLPLIAGLGLLNSGITGWCGLAKLIAKMPWNK